MSALFIRAALISGLVREDTVFIPTIYIIPSEYPFTFKIIKLPVKINFAIIINNYQEEYLQTVGQSSRSPFFSYGKLCVSCSGAGDKTGVCFISKRKNNQISIQSAL
jgi:hypothetical protein